MGAAMFIGMGLLLILAVPTLTCFHAKHLGRNQKLWFFLGFILPGIATLILSFLPDLSEQENKEVKNNL